MAFPLDDIYPGVGDPNAKHPDTFGPLGVLPNGIRCNHVIAHTTEYGSGLSSFSRAEAVRCANDQANGQAGSYNWIIYDRNQAGGERGGILLTVPYLEASGGVDPLNQYYAPGRFPWLRELLGAQAYSDPARYGLQFAFSGDTALIAQGQLPDNMVETAAKLLLWIEAQPWGADNLVLSGHLHWSTNRSDPTAAILERIIERMQRPTIPTPPPDYETLYEAEVAKVATLTRKLRNANTRITTIKAESATSAAKIASI